MNAKLIAICTIIVLIVYVDTSNGKRGRSGGSSGLYSSRSRGSSSSSNFKKTGHTGGSQPGKIGWNVPEKKPTATNAGPKPSAPVNEHAAKSSASNVQSGYNPSGGYPRQQANNPYQSSNPSPGQGYNPSPGHPYGAPPPYSPPGSYNPGVGGHAPYGAPPAYGAPPVHGAPPAYGAPSFGQPSYGHSYSPSMGQMPQQTVLLQQSKPGIGQLAKEAFVFAGVSAGVNAAVNRLIPGGIYGTRGTGGGGSASAVPSHTEITYNNYYNNGTAVVPAPNTEQAAAASAAQPAPAVPAVPAAPAAAAPPAGQTETSQANAGTNSAPPSNSNSQDQSGQNNPNPLGFVTSNDDLKKLTESLYEKETNSALKYITINLQGQKKDDSTNDDAAEPLLTVKDEAYEIPTVKAVLALHDNYELDVKTKEVVTSEERREESELIDKILETEVMKSTMKFLANKGYIPDDEYEFKDSLKRIWFSQFKRIDGDASSSGFETVFLAEKFDSDIIGLHNWIYYAKQESAKNLNYLGYIKDLKLGDKGAVLKIRSSLNDIVQPVSTLFVGTSPELEFALYTMCFFTRPNNLCPVSLAGHEFSIIVSRINYFGKDILISGYPDI